MTLNRRLIMSGMALMAIILALAALLITLLVNRQFDQYVTSGQTNSMETYYEQISVALLSDNEDNLALIGTNAVTEDFYIEVLLQDGSLLYGSQNITGMSRMGDNVSLLQLENMPMYRGIEVKSWVIDGEDRDYLLNIGYNTGQGLSEEARRFKNSVYGGIFITFIIGMVISFLVSQRLAKPISTELVLVSQGAKKIASGELDHRLPSGGTVKEIADLKEVMNGMAITLGEQDDLRRNLVATVSHEVKTPLTVLKSQVEALIDGIYEPTHDRFDQCRDEILRLEALMARMDDYDYFAEGSYVLNLTRFSLLEELQALSTILKPQFEKKDLLISISVDSDLFIRTDRYKLRQILYNLLSNAYKFSDHGTTVGLKGTMSHDICSIEVSNKGLAISEVEQEVVFNQRYRSKNADMKDPHGKGLGLFISRSLAEVLDGNLRIIESNEQQTIFRLELKVNL